MQPSEERPAGSMGIIRVNIPNIDDTQVSPCRSDAGGTSIDSADGQRVCMLSTLIRAVSTTSTIERDSGGFAIPEDVVTAILVEIFEAIVPVHANRRRHRHVRPGTIALMSTGRVCLLPCNASTAEESDVDVDEAEDRWYWTPEKLMGLDRDGMEQDVWAVGCVLAELLLGQPLFFSLDAANQLYVMFKTLGFPSRKQLQYLGDGYDKLVFPKHELSASLPAKLPTLSPSGLDLLSRLLAWGPSERIGASQALQHPYLKEARLRHPQQGRAALVAFVAQHAHGIGQLTLPLSLSLPDDIDDSLGWEVEGGQEEEGEGEEEEEGALRSVKLRAPDWKYYLDKLGLNSTVLTHPSDLTASTATSPSCLSPSSPQAVAASGSRRSSEARRPLAPLSSSSPLLQPRPHAPSAPASAPPAPAAASAAPITRHGVDGGGGGGDATGGGDRGGHGGAAARQASDYAPRTPQRKAPAHDSTFSTLSPLSPLSPEPTHSATAAASPHPPSRPPSLPAPPPSPFRTPTRPPRTATSPPDPLPAAPPPAPSLPSHPPGITVHISRPQHSSPPSSPPALSPRHPPTLSSPFSSSAQAASQPHAHTPSRSAASFKEGDVVRAIAAMASPSPPRPSPPPTLRPSDQPPEVLLAGHEGGLPPPSHAEGAGLRAVVVHRSLVERAPEEELWTAQGRTERGEAGDGAAGERERERWRREEDERRADAERRRRLEARCVSTAQQVEDLPRELYDGATQTTQTLCEPEAIGRAERGAGSEACVDSASQTWHGADAHSSQEGGSAAGEHVMAQDSHLSGSECEVGSVGKGRGVGVAREDDRWLEEEGVVMVRRAGETTAGARRGEEGRRSREASLTGRAFSIMGRELESSHGRAGSAEGGGREEEEAEEVGALRDKSRVFLKEIKQLLRGKWRGVKARVEEGMLQLRALVQRCRELLDAGGRVAGGASARAGVLREEMRVIHRCCKDAIEESKTIQSQLRVLKVALAEAEGTVRYMTLQCSAEASFMVGHDETVVEGGELETHQVLLDAVYRAKGRFGRRRKALQELLGEQKEQQEALARAMAAAEGKIRDWEKGGGEEQRVSVARRRWEGEREAVEDVEAILEMCNEAERLLCERGEVEGGHGRAKPGSRALAAKGGSKGGRSKVEVSALRGIENQMEGLRRSMEVMGKQQRTTAMQRRAAQVNQLMRKQPYGRV